MHPQAPGIDGLVTWSYFGFESAKALDGGVESEFSSKGWIGIILENGKTVSFYVQAAPFGHLVAAKDHNLLGLKAGDELEEKHVLDAVAAKGLAVEDPSLLKAEVSLLLGVSWTAISAELPTLQTLGPDWTTMRIVRDVGTPRIKQVAIYDDWRSMAPVAFD